MIETTTGQDERAEAASASGTRPDVGLSAEAPAVATVLAELLKRGPIPRIEVARRTGLSQAAVTKAVARLIERGLISTHDNRRSATPGRPVQPISVQEDGHLVVGITVRVDEIFGVVTTLSARVLHSAYRPLASTAVSSVVDGVAEVISTLLARIEDGPRRVAGVGVAVSGDVAKARGVVRDSPRLNWANVELQQLVEERCGLPVVLDNDVRALSIAEAWFGVGVDADSFAIVTIGAGIGCGLYLNGNVVEGAFGVAGELGHLPLAPAEAVCTCGRRGCVETVASTSAIMNSIRLAKADPLLAPREAVALARIGDADARAAFERAGSMIGLALATMANLIGPRVVLVAGESVTNYDLFGRSIRDAFDQHTFGSASGCEIVIRSHTFQDWARGAAASVIDSMVTGTPTAGP